MVKAAKKRKKEEEEPEFRFPEFSEEEYLRKEVQLSKLTFTTIVLAIPTGVLLFGLTVAKIPIIALFVGFAIAFALPRIYKVIPWPKFDLSKLERKDWVGQGGTFFLAWLTIWLLLLNVPFADLTAPVIPGVSVSNGTTTVTATAQQPTASLANNSTLSRFWFNATIEENGVVEGASISIPGYGARALVSVASRPTIFSAEIDDLSKTQHVVTITATDLAGNVGTFVFYLNVT